MIFVVAAFIAEVVGTITIRICSSVSGVALWLHFIDFRPHVSAST